MIIKGCVIVFVQPVVVASDLAKNRILPNQEIKFLSEIEHPLKEVEHIDSILNTTCSKRSADNFLTKAEIHRLQTYWNKYGEQLPSDFDTIYAPFNCVSCQPKH